MDLGKGLTVPEVCEQLDISQQTYYRWRTKYGGMDPQMAKQLKEMEKQNIRLKKLVAGQALDIQNLKEAARPNCSALSSDVGRSIAYIVAWGIAASGMPDARSVQHRRRRLPGHSGNSCVPEVGVTGGSGVGVVDCWCGTPPPQT